MSIILSALTTSMNEELKAFTDYKMRAEAESDKGLKDLYLHIAEEESKHYAMLASYLYEEENCVADALDKFIGVDPLSVEKD